MTRKAASLAYPNNPLAAMRDLQNLDRPENAPTSANSSAVAHPPSSERGSKRDNVDVSADTPTAERKPAPKRSSRSRTPKSDAVWAMLRQPYTADARKGPFTVSTVTIPTEVWARLGWVATLTGRPKQEIITDALKTHFEKVLEART